MEPSQSTGPCRPPLNQTKKEEDRMAPPPWWGGRLLRRYKKKKRVPGNHPSERPKSLYIFEKIYRASHYKRNPMQDRTESKKDPGSINRGSERSGTRKEESSLLPNSPGTIIEPPQKGWRKRRFDGGGRFRGGRKGFGSSSPKRGDAGEFLSEVWGTGKIGIKSSAKFSLKRREKRICWGYRAGTITGIGKHF